MSPHAHYVRCPTARGAQCPRAAERALSAAWRVRALVFLLFQLAVTPVYAAVMLLLFWLPRVPDVPDRGVVVPAPISGARAGSAASAIASIGAENIPSTPHIVLSKHSSTWETLALTLFFPPLAYVAKKELLSIPFFGWGFALASPITIDRKAGTDAMHQIAAQGRERFRQGFWIVIYPEGTRIRAGTRSKYKTGGARLAIELGVPILPVAHNAGYLWPKGVFGKRPGTVTISFGKPIPPDGKDARR